MLLSVTIPAPEQILLQIMNQLESHLSNGIDENVLDLDVENKWLTEKMQNTLSQVW
ncbi:MAG: hypothetical protein Q4E61_00950 [Alphaproteobacteria bacterium]|nr:hypothetical protein [Alphaproteobacteria bacterium]